MDLLKFEKEIRKGTGKAFLLLRNNTNLTKSIEDILYNASIHNLAYDAQVEGSRAYYLYNLISHFNNNEILVNRIVTYFKRMRKNNWDAYQLFDLIKIFIENGIRLKRGILYKKVAWYINKFKNDDVPGIETLIELDGTKGFLFVAKNIGEIIEENSEYWTDDYLLTFTNKITKKNCYSILQEKSKTNKYLQNYLEAIDINRNKFKPNHIKLASYKTLIRKIKQNESIPYYWGIRADKTELKKFASYLEKTTDENYIEKGLRIFTKVRYPFGYKSLLKYLEFNNSIIIDYTLESLALFKGKTVRQVGLQCIQNKKHIDSALLIFENNFHESDIPILDKILSDTNSENMLHYKAMVIKKIFLKNKSNKAYKILNTLYDKLNCGFCRADIIRGMQKSNILNNSIINEMKYDSYYETRALYQKIIRGKSKEAAI